MSAVLNLPLVILTGAGISADSHVPTFRGSGGLWRSHRVQELATPLAFNQNPKLVWSFYRWRRGLIRSCLPNPAHFTITSMQQTIPDVTIITQNVDGLHQASGSRAVLELHGSIWKLRCTLCQGRWEDRREQEEQHSCPFCGALARPDVVWFGERLDPHRLAAAIAASRLAATMLIIGTSGLVYPAAGLPQEARRAGVRLLEFNLQESLFSSDVDEFYPGRAAETLPHWWKNQTIKAVLNSGGE